MKSALLDVVEETINFFKRFCLSEDFLATDPTTWTEHDSFKQGYQTLKKLKVVNDTAERGVKLIEEYNKLITNDAKQKEFVLQIVRDYRHRFPDAKKETLMKHL